jgi:hypothetical protein
MMQEVHAHMLSMNPCTEHYLVSREVNKREFRYTATMNVKHNAKRVMIHEPEWRKPQDCAHNHSKMERKRYNYLHTETDRCTIIPFTANANEETTVVQLVESD